MPMRDGNPTRTGISYWPALSLATSTVASNAAASAPIASRGPRTYTVMAAGVTVARPSPFRILTGTFATAHSSWAGDTLTVTRTGSGSFRRTDGSETPTLTDSVSGADAPAAEIGSVIAVVIAATALDGPTISTVDGSAVTVPISKPGAG